MNLDIKQLMYYHPHLRKLLLWLEEATGLGFTITSQFRIKDKGVHGTLPLRADDLRIRNTTVGHALALIINQHWIYDPNRPEMHCAVLHGKGSELHLHIQVHASTQVRY